MTTTEIKSELTKARYAERAYRLARDKYIAYQQLLVGGRSVRYHDTGSTHYQHGDAAERAYSCWAGYAAEGDKRMRARTGA